MSEERLRGADEEDDMRTIHTSLLAGVAAGSVGLAVLGHALKRRKKTQ